MHLSVHAILPYLSYSGISDMYLYLCVSKSLFFTFLSNLYIRACTYYTSFTSFFNLIFFYHRLTKKFYYVIIVLFIGRRSNFIFSLSSLSVCELPPFHLSFCFWGYFLCLIVVFFSDIIFFVEKEILWRCLLNRLLYSDK